MDMKKDYKFPDGSAISEIQKGIPSYNNRQNHTAYAVYNYTDVDRRVLNIYAGAEISRSENEKKSVTTYSDMPDYSFLSSNSYSNKPKSFYGDIFYKENLPSGQNISAEISGYYTGSDQRNRIFESNTFAEGVDEFLNITDIRGSGYGLTAMADYEKRTDKIALYSGIQFKRAGTDNSYTGTTVCDSRIVRDDIYGYVQINGQVNKFSYMAELGGYGQFVDSDGDKSREGSLKAGVQLAYGFNDKARLSFRSSFYNRSIGLSNFSNAERYIGRYVIMKGNPYVKSACTFDNSLDFTYRNKIFFMFLSYSIRYTKDMPYAINSFDNERNLFVSQIKNIDKGLFNTLSGYFSIDLIPYTLSLELSGTVFSNRDEGYGHVYNNLRYQGSAGIRFNRKNWTVVANVRSKEYLLDWNVAIQKEWPSDYIEVGYRHKGLYVAAYANGVMFAGVDYTGKYESDDWLMPFTQITHKDDYSPNVGLKLSWNFSWGRRSNNMQRGAYVPVDSGIL